VDAGEGAHREGAVLLGAAESIRRSIGVGVWVTDATSHDRTEEKLCAALGDDAYREAFADGLGLSEDEVTALVSA
jgi:hypothetical protein